MTDSSDDTPPIWYVYLARCADKSLYCGVTNDLTRRLAQHNGDIPGGAKYTHARRPVSYAYTFACVSRSEALKLEIQIKNQQSPAAKIQYIQNLQESSCDS